ncbi:MAG TPA: NAD(P)H-hydrate dehydratase [Gammaproteobacteria bacterium]
MSVPPERLPREIYSTAQVRELERAASERHGIPSYELMRRAGTAAFELLRREWPAARRIAVCCGPGNNGGDGYTVARLAHGAGLEVRAVAASAPERLRGDAARAHADAAAAGVPIEPWKPGDGWRADVLVDALFGIGLAREVTGELADVVEAINAAGLPVLALDIPSGLESDTGMPLGRAVRAAVTVTFIGLKQGLFLGRAPDYCGRLELADLAVPGAALEPPLKRLLVDDLAAALPRRPRTAHKGTNGRLLVVGGGPGMPGAARMAAEAALRTGAGLVYVAAHPSSAPAVAAGRPEAICHAVTEPAELDPLLEGCDGVVAGPGLGRSPWAEALWRRVLAAERPVVADADALNLLAAAPAPRGRWLLTPHPGEAARLLGESVGAIQGDRRRAALDLAERYRAAVVLKGARSLVVTAGNAVWVCDRGNPGMATAGMGDVLSGVLGALIVQTGDLDTAARAGVLLHALAGDDAAAAGERGTLATDLMPHLRRWANPT